MKYSLVYNIDLFFILNVCIYVYIYIYIYIYVCMYVCMYITKNILNKIWRNELILSSLDLSTILNKREKFFRRNILFTAHR